MKKKLTDEEIVKRLEYGYNEKTITQNALDLIHRLQEENTELRENVERWETVYKICEERKYRKMFNEEWKKEYQKELDKKGEGLIAGSPDFDYVYELYFKQKAEIERLTEENNRLNKKLYDFGMEIELNINQITSLERENKTLQKQVDELKERYLEESKERLEFEQRYKKIQHAHNIGLGSQRSQWEKKVKQAVKDTAKEICDLILEHWEKNQFVECDWLRVAISERYGVEVE